MTLIAAKDALVAGQDPELDPPMWNVVDIATGQVHAFHCTEEDAKRFAASPELEKAVQLLATALRVNGLRWGASHQDVDALVAHCMHEAGFEEAPNG